MTEAHTPEGWLKLAEHWQARADKSADPKLADIYFRRADEAFGKALLAEATARQGVSATSQEATS